MPFSYSADGVFDTIKNNILSGYLSNKPYNVAFKPYGIQSINEVTYLPQYWLTTDGTDRPMHPIVTKFRMMDNTNQIETVTREELRNFFDFVQNNTDTNYRNVKNNQLWRKVYGVRPKVFSTYNSKTEKLEEKTFNETTYCQRCGIILPLRNLTIDHQKPQSGGDMEAMMRVFRAMGLTMSTGAGLKNRYLQHKVSGLVGGNTTILALGNKGSVNDRYSHNVKGITYYSILKIFNMVDEMKQMSMHHIVNLRPMCGPCNSSLRNSNLIWI
jgi:hypothetical protein